MRPVVIWKDEGDLKLTNGGIEMSQMTCSCGTVLAMDDPEVLMEHSAECTDAVMIGPPFQGEVKQWYIKTEDGFVVGLHAVHIEEFETPKDGMYLKIWDAGKNHPRELKKGTIVRQGTERRQVLRGVEHIVFNAEWLGEPVKG